MELGAGNDHQAAAADQGRAGATREQIEFARRLGVEPDLAVSQTVVERAHLVAQFALGNEDVAYVRGVGAEMPQGQPALVDEIHQGLEALLAHRLLQLRQRGRASRPPGRAPFRRCPRSA